MANMSSIKKSSDLNFHQNSHLNCEMTVCLHPHKHWVLSLFLICLFPETKISTVIFKSAFI